MLRSSSQLVSTLLLALIFLVGCGAGGEKPDQGRKAIYAPVEVHHVVENPLEIIDIRVSEDENQSWTYFQISGLRDQGVEDKVNGAIESLFKKMVPYATGEKLLPYRGAESALQGSREVLDGVIWVMPQFNCNNVLSVMAYVMVTYDNPNPGPDHFLALESLNFDLNTGETFSITDVFTDDADGLGIANEAIADEIKRRNTASDIYSDFALAAPFKGIGRDQKFYLAYDGLRIVIDYNNPEFDVGFSYIEVAVPFYGPDGYMAITERFYDKDRSIFVNEHVTKRFLEDNYRNFSSERDSYRENGAEWIIYLARPKDLPEGFNEPVDALRLDRGGRAAFSERGLAVSLVEQNIYVHRIGPYVNISSYLHIITDANESLWEETYCTYTEAGKPLEIKDLFVDGYDYHGLINDTVQGVLKEYGPARDLDIEVLPEDWTFKLDETGISFITKPYEWSFNSKHPLSFHISYGEIGYDNLKAFVD
ncbi:RsiV family protein [Desulfofalx alkaliphila]|uniref:RsiV family protein n=1 Tax=Desulfofalx alkaliphila TaxID=105483 RepID=UPI0004E1C441|nr:RsiV family protein [Desulfofalx alkaliphila]